MEGSQISAALEKLSQTFAGCPEKARAKQASAIATLESGLKCRVAGPAGEEIKTDMPRAMGGDASDPNPGWFFRASLASCCATVIAMRAARLASISQSSRLLSKARAIPAAFSVSTTVFRRGCLDFALRCR